MIFQPDSQRQPWSRDYEKARLGMIVCQAQLMLTAAFADRDAALAAPGKARLVPRNAEPAEKPSAAAPACAATTLVFIGLWQSARETTMA